MITYADKAIPAYSYLWGHHNDVDIFVEDVRGGAVWLRYLSRLLEPKLKIKKVFELGGREKVIEQAHSLAGDFTRPRVFIIDGDLELWLGVPAPKMPGLLRIDRYCFENLLIDENSLVAVAWEYHGGLSEDEVREILSYGELARTLTSGLGTLFLIFALQRKFMPEVETVGIGVGRFMDKKGVLNRQAIAAEVRKRLKDLRRTVSSDVLLSARRELRAVLESPDKIIEKISGKDFVMPFVHKRLTTHFSCRESRAQIPMRLALHCDMRAGDDIRRMAIQQVNYWKVHRR